MNGLPHVIDNLLWGHQEEYFKKGLGYSAPCLSFVKMQIVRLTMLLLVFVVWSLNFYINVKKCIIYLNFWALTLTLLALGFLFTQSGRQVIERKLTERKELEDDKRSNIWKWGVALYSLAWPFTVTSTLLFSIFFWEDQVCQTYYDFGFQQWRGYIAVVATYMPMFALLMDFSFNRVTISYKQIIVTIILLVLYFFSAFVGTAVQQRPAYGNHLGFLTHNNFKWDEVRGYSENKNNQWAQERINQCEQHFGWDKAETSIPVNVAKTGITVGILIATMLITHVLVTMLSNWKAQKYFERDGRINEINFKKEQLLEKNGHQQ